MNFEIQGLLLKRFFDDWCYFMLSSLSSKSSLVFWNVTIVCVFMISEYILFRILLSLKINNLEISIFPIWDNYSPRKFLPLICLKILTLSFVYWHVLLTNSYGNLSNVKINGRSLRKWRQYIASTLEELEAVYWGTCSSNKHFLEYKFLLVVGFYETTLELNSQLSACLK